MNLLRSQFDVLTCLEAAKNKSMTQKDVVIQTGLSAGAVNKAFSTLREAGCITENKITGQGIAALEPYRVRRAIFLAAGFGERLIPITLNTPKPLVRVKGVRLIDTMLNAVYQAGIEEVVIVRGYLSEQFDQLLYKYPGLRFIENPIYNETNNISSMMCARYLLKNAYVLDADFYLLNPKIVTKYQYTSNYMGIPVDFTDDWCMESRGGIITKMALGGRNCHLMLGFSYWTEEDGTRLAEHIKQAYEMPGGKERYWDQVPLEYFAKEYRISIRECSEDDIIEIDTYNSLKQLDGTYL